MSLKSVDDCIRDAKSHGYIELDECRVTEIAPVLSVWVPVLISRGIYISGAECFASWST